MLENQKRKPDQGVPTSLSSISLDRPIASACELDTL